MLVALVVVVLFGAIQALSDDASDELSDRGDTIGHPTEVGGVVAPPPGGGGGGGGGTPPPGPSYTGAINASCSGGGGDKNVCTYTLNPDPSPLVPVWSITPATNTSGAPPVVTFLAEGDFTVQATIDGTTVAHAVTCKRSGSNLQCDKK